MIAIEKTSSDNVSSVSDREAGPSAHSSALPAPDPLHRFLRYCVVGASSFLVGLVLFNIFLRLTGQISLSNTLAFALSVVNGFIWNRRWTFRDKRGRPAWEQASKFAVVNLVGYGLSQIVIGLVIAAWTTSGGLFGHATWQVALSIVRGGARDHYSLLLVNGAGVVATAVVVVWNYIANKCWSFRH